MRSSNSFSTQAEIMKQMNQEDSQKEICSELANLFANYKMGKGNRNFLDNGPRETIKEVIRERKFKNDIKEQFAKKAQLAALLSLHSSFLNNKILFKTDAYPVNKMSGAQGFKEGTNHSNHVLINYPTHSKQSQPKFGYHQVYFGKDGQQCSYFNSNLQGGEREGSCDEIIALATTDIKENAADDGRPCLVSRSI